MLSASQEVAKRRADAAAARAVAMSERHRAAQIRAFVGAAFPGVREYF